MVFTIISSLIIVDIISHIAIIVQQKQLTIMWDGGVRELSNGDTIRLGRRSDGIIVWENVILK